MLSVLKPQVDGPPALTWEKRQRKLAVTDLAALVVTLHVLVPVHAPDQPVKVEIPSAAAVSVTSVPVAKPAEQVLPHAIPAGKEVMVPLPDPMVVTLKMLVLASGPFVPASLTPPSAPATPASPAAVLPPFPLAPPAPPVLLPPPLVVVPPDVVVPPALVVPPLVVVPPDVVVPPALVVPPPVLAPPVDTPPVPVPPAFVVPLVLVVPPELVVPPALVMPPVPGLPPVLPPPAPPMGTSG
jgi:hypothetical protein